MTTRSLESAFGEERAITPPLAARIAQLTESLGVTPESKASETSTHDALVAALLAAHDKLALIAAQVEHRWAQVQEREKEVAIREARAIAHEKRLAGIEALAPVLTPAGKEPAKRGWFG